VTGQRAIAPLLLLLASTHAGGESAPHGTASPPPARTYATACGTCHDNGGYAVRVLADRLGPERALIHRTNRLSPEAIRAIVRNGIGAMPAMSKLEVSDSELEAIVEQLGRARVPTTAR
jgi:mono/diheme cytochrome c family protein